MGQIYIALEPGRNEYVLPNAFGSGAKRHSIVASGVATLDAMAIMLSDPGIARRPADVHLPSRTGRWAGKRVVIHGQHAMRGDTADWCGAVPEDEAYDHARNSGFEMGGSMVTPIHRIHGMAAARMRIRTDGVTFMHPVPIGLRREGARLVVDEEGSPGEHLAAMRAQVAKRIAGADPDSYVVDAWDGSRRVIANLDRCEYVDPEQVAEIPTLAGMMRGQIKRWRREDPESTKDIDVPTSLSLMARMLFTPDPLEDVLLGRWRGDRIVITNERSRNWPTTMQVKGGRDWDDITPRIAEGDFDWPDYHQRSMDHRYGEIAPEAA